MAGQNLRNSLPHTEDYLFKIYNKTKRDLVARSNKDTADWAKAKKLEAFFQLIKSTQKYIQSNGTVSVNFSSFWNKTEQISLIRDLYQTNAQLFASDDLLFLMGFDTTTLQMSKDVTSAKLGEYLEHGINRLVKTFQANITNKDYDTLDGLVVGPGKRQLDLTHVIYEIGRETLADLYNTTSDAMHEAGHKDTIGHSFTPKVWGKIDNTGLRSEIKLQGLSKIKQDIAECLRGATFTSKNYISSNDIKLGNTNPFRIFLTIPAFEQNLQRWHRMMNCFKSHTFEHSEAPMWFYRIRLIYELTGFGGYYDVKTQEEFGKILSGMTYAKYLIINKPGTSDLRVIPTAAIINAKSILEKEENKIRSNTWQDAVYGPVVINQNDLLNF